MYSDIRNSVVLYNSGVMSCWIDPSCAVVFPSDTVISLFTAEIWAIIKALEQIKDSFTSKYIIFSDSLSCLQALQDVAQR